MNGLSRGAIGRLSQRVSGGAGGSPLRRLAAETRERVLRTAAGRRGRRGRRGRPRSPSRAARTPRPVARLGHPARAGVPQPLRRRGAWRRPIPARRSPSRRTYSLARSGSAVSAGPFAAGPTESTIAVQCAPSSVVIWSPSAVAITVVSPRVAIPPARHVLPFGAELVVGPAPPGLPAVQRQAPSVPHGAVPDLAPRPEAEGVHEVPGERAGRGVAPDHLPGPARRTGADRSPCRRCPARAVPSGSRAAASTWTPQPALSGSGGERRPARPRRRGRQRGHATAATDEAARARTPNRGRSERLRHRWPDWVGGAAAGGLEPDPVHVDVVGPGGGEEHGVRHILGPEHRPRARGSRAAARGRTDPRWSCRSLRARPASAARRCRDTPRPESRAARAGRTCSPRRRRSREIRCGRPRCRC